MQLAAIQLYPLLPLLPNRYSRTVSIFITYIKYLNNTNYYIGANLLTKKRNRLGKDSINIILSLKNQNAYYDEEYNIDNEIYINKKGRKKRTIRSTILSTNKELITINDVPTSPIRDLDLESNKSISSKSTTSIGSFNKEENRTDSSNLEKENTID